MNFPSELYQIIALNIPPNDITQYRKTCKTIFYSVPLSFNFCLKHLQNWDIDSLTLSSASPEYIAAFLHLRKPSYKSLRRIGVDHVEDTILKPSKETFRLFKAISIGYKYISWTASNSLIPQILSSGGYLSPLKIIIESGSFDPSSTNNLCLHSAVINSQYNVVDYLLNSTGVDPCSENNFSLRHACLNGNIAIIKLLLSDKRLNVAQFISECSATRYAYCTKILTSADMIGSNEAMSCA